MKRYKVTTMLEGEGSARFPSFYETPEQAREVAERMVRSTITTYVEYADTLTNEWEIMKRKEG